MMLFESLYQTVQVECASILQPHPPATMETFVQASHPCSRSSDSLPRHHIGAAGRLDVSCGWSGVIVQLFEMETAVSGEVSMAETRKLVSCKAILIPNMTVRSCTSA